MANPNAHRFLSLSPETPADVAQALRYCFNALQDHYDAFKQLKSQQAAAGTSSTTVVNSTTVTGNVSGPGSSVAGDVAVFSGTSGKVIADGGALPRFADNEVAGGSGTAWTLANTPSPSDSLLLFVKSTGLFLTQGTGYTLAGAAITTIASYAAGELIAFYRY